MMSDDVLRIENLTKKYVNQDTECTIIHDFSLAIKEREFLCILGPSGCGKTTLLRCIAGFEDYDGTVFVNDEVKKEPDIERMMVFQDYNQLFPWQTVEKNIQYPLRIQGIQDKQVLKKISDEALAKVNLNNISNYYPFQLSGGMKQRVAIAKALALKPKIVLMDEPFAALDSFTRRALQNELLRISKEEECTFIFVTHNIQEAIVLGTRHIVLATGGKIVLDEYNPLLKPVTPASDGYGPLWKKLYTALYPVE